MYAPHLFKDKVALVTGGRSGIGYAIAKQLLELGAKVTICARKEEPLQKAAEELSKAGPCDFRACDIRDTDQIRALAAQIRDRQGRLDILVNNAGGQFPALAENISDNGWETVIKNNLSGTFFMTREMANTFFIPQKGGVIVNIIANMHRGFPGMIHTGAARAGVENMTKTLAQEWAKYHIRINCIAPGIIESEGLKTYPKPVQSMFEQAKMGIPMQQFGTVEDVANATSFLASPLAAYVTGITLYVDGAQHLNYDGMGLANFMAGMT
ncbi:MAG: SDR family oxidoreductase [Bacteroidia bacterium]|nr:SDR family oxidoreductase [Bacteroidia bacterium]